MYPSFRLMRTQLATILNEKYQQGHLITGLHSELEGLPESYDAFHAFAHKVARLPMRADWPYVEPSDLAGIWAECDPSRPMGVMGAVDVADAAKRVETAFLASCCGCILGKPLEINPTLAEVRKALESTGEWPLRDYVSEKIAPALPRPFHGSWKETVRERIAYVAPDDDINYTILGMLILEDHGIGFTKLQLRDKWMHHLPIATTFGPERTMLVRSGMASYGGPGTEAELDEWASVMSFKEEYCGALIRADAYGYACPGRPALAAELAWRDASFTHRRTGIYGTMFVAAAIAAAQMQPKGGGDRLDVFATALKFVPRRSRFYRIVEDSLNEVAAAKDWLDGYGRIHGKYKQYTHCQIFQEVGTLINTLQFAEDIGDGICKQVAQGNDTDSFGATAGSILGCYFGPGGRGGLEGRWLAPFHDELRTALAWFFERSLTQVARRMGALPGKIDAELKGQVKRAADGPAAQPGAAAGI